MLRTQTLIWGSEKSTGDLLAAVILPLTQLCVVPWPQEVPLRPMPEKNSTLKLRLGETKGKCGSKNSLKQVCSSSTIRQLETQFPIAMQDWQLPGKTVLENHKRPQHSMQVLVAPWVKPQCMILGVVPPLVQVLPGRHEAASFPCMRSETESI